MRGRYCSVDGCQRVHYAKKLCRMHWTRQHNGSDVGGAQPLREGRKVVTVPIQPSAPAPPTWGARCILCRNVVSEGGTASDAQRRLDVHLFLTHGISA